MITALKTTRLSLLLLVLALISIPFLGCTAQPDWIQLKQNPEYQDCFDYIASNTWPAQHRQAELYCARVVCEYPHRHYNLRNLRAAFIGEDYGEFNLYLKTHLQDDQERPPCPETS